MLDTNSPFDDPNEDDPQDQQREFLESISSITNRLEKEATRRIGRRQTKERQWIEDLEQYHGRYDQATETRLNNKDKPRSSLFINLTRPKTDAMAARLQDLLFPTDDQNWEIQPTPIPELSDGAQEAQSALRKLEEKLKKQKDDAEQQAAAQNGQVDPSTVAEINRLQEAADVIKRHAADLNKQLDEARSRADLMSRQIDDQLIECQYNAVMRDVIDDACKIGTGVAKGPVTGDKVRKGWKLSQTVDEFGNSVSDFTLQVGGEDTPAMRYVDIWNFFPDPDARTIDESNGVFERHLLNGKKLRAMAQLPGFSKDAIRELLKSKPKSAAPSYLADLRKITNSNQSITGEMYHVWEYSGPLDAEEMQVLALAMGDDQTAQEYADIDPLTEVNAVVWFCQGQVLKFGIYPYDSGEPMYSVFNLFKDEATIFGYGIPWVMRDPQRSLNAGWRAMMDNAAATAGPQIVVAEGVVDPEDGNWTIEPLKVWLAKEGIPQGNRAFDAFSIPSVQNEMGAIIRLSMEFIDLMTAMPSIAQGEQGTGITKTAQGMAILMNSANVTFRRIVKNFDDDVTTPNIRRFYDWNMQFNSNPDIKGDYQVDARGSGALMMREMQAQNTMTIMAQFGAHPIYGPMFKQRELLAQALKANSISVDQVLLSDDEIAAAQAKIADQQKQAMDAAAQAKGGGASGADPSIAQAEIELKRHQIDASVEMANLEAETRKMVAQSARDTAMMQMAEKMNMSIDKINADLQKTQMINDHKERSLAAEAAVAIQTGQHAGGAV